MESLLNERLAQLDRALASGAKGCVFESRISHFFCAHTILTKKKTEGKSSAFFSEPLFVLCFDTESLVEAFDTSSSVYEFLLACVERVASGTNFYVDVL